MDGGDGEVNFLCLCVTKCVYDINVTESGDVYSDSVLDNMYC